MKFKQNIPCYIQSLISITLVSCTFWQTVSAAECSDKNAIEAAMSASQSVMNGNSFRKPKVLKRHHPSKRKEVATYFESDDLYYTLYWLVSDNCTAGFIKRTQGKR
ncbi:hypothetical protein [Marinomonas ostreistagni]|nr:hypothetical protein [Marinomonas ostreistagni]